MARRWVRLALVLAGLAAQPAVVAQAGAQVRQGKLATALVVLPRGQGSATAFCIDPGGLFVTCAHVVRDLPAGEQLTLVLNAGETGEVSVPVATLRVDPKTDLALLGTRGPQTLTALPLGDATSLVETAPVTAFGYPFGDLLAAAGAKYPSISVNVARITSLRRAQGRLEMLQLDSQLNPGNSGGPVLDAAGRVVGVVSSGLDGAGINFAVPVNTLREVLRHPSVALVGPPDVPYPKRYDPLDLEVRLVPFVVPPMPLTVEVVLGSGQPGEERRFAGKDVGVNHYTARVQPLPRPEGAAELAATVDSADGSVRCRLADQTIALDGRPYALSQIKRLERRAEQVSLVLRDGRQDAGRALTGGPLRARLGGLVVAIELTTVTAIALADPDAEAEPAEVACTVVVRQGGEVLAQQVSRLRIASAPAPPATGPAPPAATTEPVPVPGPTAPAVDLGAGLAALPPTQVKDRLEVPLPGKFGQMRIAAGGRYLIFHIKGARKLVVFDVAQGQLVREIGLPSDDVLLAAGAEKLIVVLPTVSLLQRWSLATFERELTVSLPGAGSLRIAMLGPRSYGPLYLWSGGTVQAVDLNTLRPMKLDGLLGGDPTHGYRLRASFDGHVLTGWHSGLSPDPTRMMRLEGGRAVQQQLPGEMSHTMRWQVPNGNGSYLFDHGGAMRDSTTLNDVAGDALHGSMMVPCLDDRYFLAIRDDAISVCTTCDRQQVYVVSPLAEMKGAGGYVSDNEPRYYYFPTADLLMTIPTSDDRVVLRRFSLLDSLRQHGIDYLFVDSLPPARVKAGVPLAYQLAIHSKAGGLKLRLEAGPEGMKVSDTGLVTWTPGRAQRPGTVSVIISVADASGQERFHNFDLNVS